MSLSLAEQATAAKAAHLELCRKNFAVFVSYVMRDEQTGKKLQLAWLHKKWANLAASTRRLNIISATELGKSQILSVAYPLWCLGNDPRLRIAIISASNSMASKILQLIGHYIVESPELREVFPKLKPAEHGSWTNDHLTVERPVGTKDPSVGSYGVDTKRLHGSRQDVVICDDIDSPKTTATAEGRVKLAEWVSKMVISRVRGGQIISVSNAWHQNDWAHTLAKQKGYVTVKCPVIVSQEVLNQWPDSPYKIGDSIWPERWSFEQIEARRADVANTPGEFERAMLCRPRSDDLSWFRESDLEIARKRGDGMTIVQSLEELALKQGLAREDVQEERALSDATALCRYYPNPEKDPDSIPNYVVCTGVDLASGRNKDQTAIVTVARLHDGSRLILNVQRGNYQGAELVRRLKDTHRLYGGVFIVETNSIQRTLAQILSDIADLPIVQFETRNCDKLLGFSRISAEFSKWLWVFPSHEGRCEETLELLLAGLIDYTPAGHTEDSAMAMLFASDYINKLELSWGGVRLRLYTGAATG